MKSTQDFACHYSHLEAGPGTSGKDLDDEKVKGTCRGLGECKGGMDLFFLRIAITLLLSNKQQSRLCMYSSLCFVVLLP